MLVEYVGDYDEVSIAASGQIVRRGEPVDVDDVLGASLCEQSDSWRAVDVPAVPRSGAVTAGTQPS